MKAEDYAWFRRRIGSLEVAYCLTLVRGLTPVEALERIDAEPAGRVTGVDAFVTSCPSKHAYGSWYVGATALDDWTLLVEWCGLLGVTTKVIEPLSAGTQVVSHYRNVDAEDRFCWMVDGDLRLQFEPLFAYSRTGSDPDGLVDVMQQVGFDLRDIEDRDFELHTEAAFALAEHLTGVRLTAELLESADYLCGLVG